MVEESKHNQSHQTNTIPQLNNLGLTSLAIKRISNELIQLKTICDDKDFQSFKIHYIYTEPIINIYLTIGDCDYLITYKFLYNFPFKPPQIVINQIQYTKSEKTSPNDQYDVIISYPFQFTDYNHGYTVHQFVLSFIADIHS